MPQMTARGTRAFESDKKKTRQKMSVRTTRVRQKFVRAVDEYAMQRFLDWCVFVSFTAILFEPA